MSATVKALCSSTVSTQAISLRRANNGLHQLQDLCRHRLSKDRQRRITKDIRSRQIDELIRQSEDERRDVYGPNWDDDTRNFYNLFERTRRMPTYRPRISAPQLQLLLLQEAGDSTDTNMRVFIHKKDERNNKRRKPSTAAFAKNLVSGKTTSSTRKSGSPFLQLGFSRRDQQGAAALILRIQYSSSSSSVGVSNESGRRATWIMFSTFFGGTSSASATSSTVGSRPRRWVNWC